MQPIATKYLDKKNQNIIDPTTDFFGELNDGDRLFRGHGRGGSCCCNKIKRNKCYQKPISTNKIYKSIKENFKSLTDSHRSFVKLKKYLKTKKNPFGGCCSWRYRFSGGAALSKVVVSVAVLVGGGEVRSGVVSDSG